jgi:hypothetical protein
LTDGVINDLEKTICEIVKGSTMPLSIIIVGVGNADFEQMELLDGDVSPLYSNILGKYMARDIVQFVPFNEVKNDPYLLAKKVLEEVPKQLTDYFQSLGMKPNPKRFEDKQAIVIQGKMKNQLANMMKVPDNYFQRRKVEMYN